MFHNESFKFKFRRLKIIFQEPVIFEDVKDEIFDMVKPDDPYHITLSDLLRSGQGETVVNILSDLNGFWSYENREMLLAETPEDENF